MKLLVAFLVCALSALGLGLALFVFAVLASVIYHVAFVASAVAAVLTLVGLLARRARESVELPRSSVVEENDDASVLDGADRESVHR